MDMERSTAISSSQNRSRSSKEVYRSKSLEPVRCRYCKTKDEDDKNHDDKKNKRFGQHIICQFCGHLMTDEDDEKNKRLPVFSCNVCDNLKFTTTKGLTLHMEHIHRGVLQKAQEDEDKKNEDQKFEMAKIREMEAADSTCTICKLCFPTIEALADHDPLHFRNMVYSKYGVRIDEEKQKEDEKKLCFSCTLCKFAIPTADALAHDIVHYRVALYCKFVPVDEDYDKIGVLPPSSVALHQQQHTFHELPRFSPVAPLEDGYEKKGEDGKEFWMTDKNSIFLLRMYAQAALDYYNKQNVGERYALVEHGPNRTTGRMDHINFKAKKEDCSSAQVETFFAQLTFDLYPQVNKPAFWVDCCISLGLSRNLPHWRNAELGGCGFCGGIINHPTEKVAGLSLEPN